MEALLLLLDRDLCVYTRLLYEGGYYLAGLTWSSSTSGIISSSDTSLFSFLAGSRGFLSDLICSAALEPLCKIYGCFTDSGVSVSGFDSMSSITTSMSMHGD